MPVTALLAVRFLGWSWRRHRRRMVAGRQAFDRMAALLPATLAAAKARAVVAPPPPERGMDRQQITALRYALDRGLQPADQWNGFDIVDEFQTAAREAWNAPSRYIWAFSTFPWIGRLFSRR